MDPGLDNPGLGLWGAPVGDGVAAWRGRSGPSAGVKASATPRPSRAVTQSSPHTGSKPVRVPGPTRGVWGHARWSGYPAGMLNPPAALAAAGRGSPRGDGVRRALDLSTGSLSGVTKGSAMPFWTPACRWAPVMPRIRPRWRVVRIGLTCVPRSREPFQAIPTVGNKVVVAAAVVVVAGCCWLLLVVAGCCWLLLVVAGCCWLMLAGCWLVVVGCCWLLLVACCLLLVVVCCGCC